MLRPFLFRLLLVGFVFYLPTQYAQGQGAGAGYTDHVNLTYYLDEQGNRQPVESIADWEIRRKHVFAGMQQIMGPLPQPKTPVALDVEIHEEVVQENYVRKLISYHTDSEQRRVRAYLFLPKRSGKSAAVLCLHQTVTIGKQEPAGLGGNPQLHYARHLADRGFVTLAPDYPSFGDYAYTFPAADGYISGTMKAIYDNHRAVDLLQSLEQVDKQRIGCIGHSLGGHNTIFTAAFDQRIKAMVSNCGFTRFHKYYGGKLKGWTSTRYMPLINSKYNNDPDLVTFDFPEIIASFAPRPFLASAPVRDSNFEVTGVKETISQVSKIYSLYGATGNVQAIYPDAAHSFPEEARNVAYQFLEKHLSHKRD